jgi:hypothetical protein
LDFWYRLTIIVIRIDFEPDAVAFFHFGTGMAKAPGRRRSANVQMERNKQRY